MPDRTVQLIGSETQRVLVDSNMFDIGDEVSLEDIPGRLERDLNLAKAVLANAGVKETAVISIIETEAYDPVG